MDSIISTISGDLGGKIPEIVKGHLLNAHVVKHFVRVPAKFKSIQIDLGPEFKTSKGTALTVYSLHFDF